MKKKQIYLNIIANVLSFIVSTVINFFLTPYITRTVGVAAYGFVPLASSFVSYLSIITSAFNSMSGRFITIGIHEGNEEKAEKYFSTTFFMNVGLAVFASLIFTAIVAFLERFIDIPHELIADTKMLFALIFCATVIGLVAAVYTVPMFCQNRLDIKSGISILTTIVRAIVLGICFLLFDAHIYYIGLATVAVIAVESILNYITSKRLLPQLKIEKNKFDIRLIGVLFKSGVWNSFSQLSSVLMTGLDLIVANMFLGAGESGVLSLAKVFPGLIYTVVALMISAFTPQFVQDYAHSDYKSLVNTMDFSAKLIGFVSVIPMAGFVAYGKEFFSLWVPEQDATLLIILSYLMIFEQLIGYPIQAFDGVFTAANKLKWPAIVSFLCGLLNVIAMIPLLKFTSLGLYAVAGTSTFIILIKDIAFKIPYASKCANISPLHFWKLIARYLLAFSVITIISFGIKCIFPITTWVGLILEAFITVLISVIFNFLFMFDKEEQKNVMSVVSRTIKRG